VPDGPVEPVGGKHTLGHRRSAQPGVTAAIAGSRDDRHVRAEAANLDLTGPLDELNALIPLGPTSWNRCGNE
jgi:hypothetical protein